MISAKLHTAIVDQINAELWSAYLYLSMSLDAEAKGFKGVANWFYVQWLEEQDHARILMNYLNSRDAKVTLKAIEPVRTEWEVVVCNGDEADRYHPHRAYRHQGDIHPRLQDSRQGGRRRWFRTGSTHGEKFGF